jgi:hypothetical protein
MTDLKIVLVPKELYYHEVNYVRGLETAARTMLAALKEIATHWANNYDHPEMYRGPYGVGVVDGHRACAIIARAAIAQAEAAGITTGEGEREPTYYANKCECGHALGDHADELACTVAGCPCIHFADAAIAQAEAAGITVRP